MAPPKRTKKNGPPKKVRKVKSNSIDDEESSADSIGSEISEDPDSKTRYAQLSVQQKKDAVDRVRKWRKGKGKQKH